MGTLSKTDRTAIELWTACPMTFHVGRGVFITVPRFTPCKKPVYTQKMRDDLDAMMRSDPLKEGDVWIYVDLEGKRRTIRRSHVLTQREYDDVRSKDRAAMELLRAKSRRPVGQGGAVDGGGDALVAAPDGGDRGPGTDT